MPKSLINTYTFHIFCANMLFCHKVHFIFMILALMWETNFVAIYIPFPPIFCPEKNNSPFFFAFRMYVLLVQRALLVVRSRVIGGNILLHQPLQRTISLHQTHLMAHEDQHHNNSGWKFED